MFMNWTVQYYSYINFLKIDLCLNAFYSKLKQNFLQKLTSRC